MATFSSLGVGAGVDLQSMLTKLMAVERTPLNALQTKMEATSSRISLFGSLRSKLDSLSLAASTLSLPSQLSPLAASSSNETVLKANASFLASTGTYDVTVTSVAAAQKSNTVGYNSGTTFTAGAGAKLTFTLGDGGSPVTTDIDLDDGVAYSLSDIRNQINTAGLGVRATVINGADGKQYLSLMSTATGKQGTFSLATSGLTVSGGQAAIAIDPDTLPPEMKAADAEMIVNGVTVKSSTNEFSNVVTGLTFSAKSSGSATITVAASSERIASALQKFIDEYNGARSLITANSGFDLATKKSGAFNSDSTTRTILSSLNDARTQVPSELASADLKNLFEIGVSVDQSGALSLDTSKLNQAVASNPDAVIKLVQAYGNAFGNAISSVSSNTLSNRLTGLESLSASYSSQKLALEARLKTIEASYRRQFTALDTMMSSFQTTSSYLSQQLASLSSSNR